jgi:D-3-phosphoglycerate dehydrogenase
MSYVVVVADRVAEAGLRLLREEPGLELASVAGSPERLALELPRAHALLVRSDTQVTAARIDAAQHLMVIGRAGTGVDNIDVETATRRGIAVLTAPGANTVSTAEHTVALLLALVRRIPAAATSMREGRWDRKQFAGSELFGKRLGIVGLGRVGIRVARVARAFGMSVVAYDPYLPRERADEIGAELVSLEDVLASADVVTLHLPLTQDTRHLMSRERLATMKPGAVLVNAARGGLIDDVALLEALDSGPLAAAALDVFDPEPLPPDSPLRRSERILLTPHLAASTAEAQDRVAVEICGYVRDALLTGALRGAVNLPGISSDVLARMSGALELARRLGRLAASLVAGRVETVEVTFGGGDEAAPRPVMLAALEGALTAMGLDRVTLVNANELARQRGIRCSRQVGRPVRGFETTVGVTAESESARVSVVGAVVGDGVGRLIRIDQYGVDVPAEGCVLILRNRDVPGVIGKVGQELGAAAINIASYHQSRGAEAGGDALAAIVVDQIPASAVIAALEAIPEVVDVRVARLDG